MTRIVILLVLSGAIAISCARPPQASDLADGDIIFQDSESEQSHAIERATGSRYSHMGMIVFRDKVPFVYEASATVRYTPLTTWIARGRDEHYVVKRLRPEVARITPEALAKARPLLKRFDGREYDLAFGWSDERLYCSELVWKIYDRALGVEIGKLQTMKSLDFSDPAVKAKLRERYGPNIPLEEPVITPAAMFEAKELREVKRG